MPQLLSLVSRSTQNPPQLVRPGRQAQAPSRQYCERLQVLPQVPQLLGSSSVARQVWVKKPQTWSPATEQPHTPLVHTPSVGSHRLPQPPQLSRLVETSTQLPPQAMRPGGHWQTPETQVPPAGQALSHAPQ